MVLFYSPPKKQLSRKSISLNIHSIDAFGQGIAHYQGKTIFVKNALPDEEVDVQLTESKKQYAKAKVLKYHHISEERIKPVCQHYGVCGGCDMQHISSHLQHTIKRRAFSDLFEKEANYSLAQSDITVVHAKDYHYRRRARLSINLENNQLKIGFRKFESNQIIDIKQCPVLVEQLEALILPLKACLNQFKDHKALGHVELINVDSGTILVLRHIRPLAEQDIEQLTRFAQQYNVSIYLHGETLNHLVGVKKHYYSVKNLKLTFSPLDFIQVNGEINQKMIKQATDWLAITPQDHILDLFCGMGNFSLPMATMSQRVIGVEGVPALVEKAKSNVMLNQDKLIGEVSFFVGNLDSVDKTPSWYSQDINKVLLDPARLGAYQVIDTIIERTPTHIVYISCNPATLVRDSKKLLQAGYEIVKASILDMFPQTKHIESMLLFTKLGTKRDGINKRSTSAQ